MKIIIILTAIFFQVNIAVAQEKKEFDFVITIDDDFHPIYSPSLYTLDKNGIKTIYEISYHPGCLSMSIEDYKKIMSANEEIHLKFDHYKTLLGGNTHIYNYDLSVGKFWFKECTFVILKMYNLDKKKYRKKYPPLSEDKNYNFVFESSEFNTVPIKIKEKK